MKPIKLIKRSQLTVMNGPPYRVEDIEIYGDVRRIHSRHTIALHSSLNIKAVPYIWF